MSERLTLPNGDWVDLVDRLTYAERRRVLASHGEPNDARAAVMSATMLLTWSVRDRDGNPIPVPVARPIDGYPVEAIQTFPADTMDLVSIRAAELMTEGVNVPKAGAGTSGGSPSPAPPSGSTADSPTPISSPTIPAGPGTTSSEPLPISSRRSA